MRTFSQLLFVFFLALGASAVAPAEAQQSHFGLRCFFDVGRGYMERPITDCYETRDPLQRWHDDTNIMVVQQKGGAPFCAVVAGKGHHVYDPTPAVCDNPAHQFNPRPAMGRNNGPSFGQIIMLELGRLVIQGASQAMYYDLVVDTPQHPDGRAPEPRPGCFVNGKPTCWY